MFYPIFSLSMVVFGLACLLYVQYDRRQAKKHPPAK